MITYKKIISLGYDCNISTVLRDNNMREESLPFDWLVSMNTEKFVKCIEDGFSDFFKIRKVNDGKFPPYGFFKKRIGEDIYINDYDMIFLHHSHYTIDELKQKFHKKICKFNEIINSGDKILLCRKLHGSHEEKYCNTYNEMDYIMKLKQLLTKYNNIDLLVLNSCDKCVYGDIDDDNFYIRTISEKYPIVNLFKNNFTIR